MTDEILTPAEMSEADRRAIAEGPLDGYELMRNAGFDPAMRKKGEPIAAAKKPG